jgi:ATP-dependent DNA ligase
LKLSERRRWLQRLVTSQADQLLQLMLQTSNRHAASAWLDDELSISGIEGVVAKLDESLSETGSPPMAKD